MITFSNKNLVVQTFPFCDTIMKHIFENISAPQLLKLYQTCKFFYDKFHLNIIEDFEICGSKNDERIVGNSIAILHQNSSLSKLKKLWICKSFTYFQAKNGEPFEFDYNIFSLFTYSTLHLIGNFLVEDLEILVKPSSLRHLILCGKIFYPEVNSCLSIEDIIEKVPQVSTIHISVKTHIFRFPPIDMNRLICMNRRQTKLTSLHLYNLSKIPDPLLVIEFFKKHAIPEIDYYFEFFDPNPKNKQRFYKIVDDGLRAWKVSLLLPPAISSSFIDLTQKVALITGAADGIGRATVILFRQLGASVIAVSRNPGKLNYLIYECQNIKNDGFLHILLAKDGYGDKDDVKKLFDRIYYKNNAKIDILVNNADNVGPQLIPFIKFEETFCRDEYNFYLEKCNIIRAATSYLKNAKGCVIDVKACNGLVNKSEKAWPAVQLRWQIKCAEDELTSFGVRINSVGPNSSPSALPRPGGMTDTGYKKYFQKSKKSYYNEVANAIAFLASDAAKLIDGSTLSFNALHLR